MKTVKLSNCEVDINDEQLRWGQTLLIRGSLFDISKGTITPESQLESSFKRFEAGIIEIRKDGAKVVFSRDWFNGLSRSDGEKLNSEFVAIDEKKSIE